MAFDPGVAWAFLAVGAGAQVGAFLLMRRPIRLIRAGGSGTGVVVDSEEESMATGRSGPSTYFFDVVEFTTREGRTVRFTSEVGRRVGHAKGSHVRVLYDPGQPHEAVLATFATLWLFPAVTSAFGMPFLLAGLAALL